jgi:uncharacterized protein YkwD
MKTGLARITGILVATGLIAAAAPAAVAAAPNTSTAHAARACAGAHQPPTARTLRRATRATLCLLNAQRTARGVHPVHPNRALRHSARRYARAMVSNRFFSHVGPNGQTLGARMSRSGYLRGARGRAYGENLAWGAGRQATPAQIVRTWMGSPGHRANILSVRWRHIGIGIAPGAPVAGVGHAASYVTHFGSRG